VQHIAAGRKITPSLLRRAASDLGHPLLVRMPGDPRYVDASAFQMKEDPRCGHSPSPSSLAPSAPPGHRLLRKQEGGRDTAGVWTRQTSGRPVFDTSQNGVGFGYASNLPERFAAKPLSELPITRNLDNDGSGLTGFDVRPDSQLPLIAVPTWSNCFIRLDSEADDDHSTIRNAWYFDMRLPNRRSVHRTHGFNRAIYLLLHG
jgi:hypothetical protein